MKTSAVLSMCSLAALVSVVGACSGEEGRSRAEDTTAQSNLPMGGGAYVPSGAAPAGDMIEMPPAAEGTGTDLVATAGWVDGNTNGLEIQGAFFTYQDGSGRTLIANDAAESQTGYCVSGTSAEVLGGDFSGTWGAVAALNLNQEVGVDTAGSYDAAAHGVVGFGFDIVGDTGGALRFVVKQYSVHDGFCINNVPECALGCSVQYRIDELTQNCWEAGGAAPVASSLSALEWQIVPKEDAETPFDYCIENLHAIVEAPAAAPVTPEPAPY